VILRALIFLLVLGGTLVLLTSPSFAERLVFLPDRSDPGSPPVLVGVPGEVVELEAADGTRLRAWWYEARQPPEVSGEGAPAVLFLHGNAGHWGHRTFQAEGMLREGVSVLLLGYRGYGNSGEGRRPTEAGVIQDAAAGFHWLVARVGVSDRVVLHGRSLGGAVGAGLLRDPGIQPGGLVLESTFTSLEAMARAVYPGLTRILPEFLLRRLRGRFDVEGGVAGYQGLAAASGAESHRDPGDPDGGLPLLVIHGLADDLVPSAMGRAIHAAGAANPAVQVDSLLEVPGAGHNDLPWIMGADYFREVAAFVRRATAP
jgi:fermentation-respiration switch protein FrsA (DUF1100 family)